MPKATRAEALATLEEGQRALDGLFAKLADDEITRAKTIGGGEWSAKDLMGHIAFWEELALDSIEAAKAARPPAAAQIFASGGVDAANARDQARDAERSLDEVRARARSAHERLVDAIQGMSDADWRAKIERGDGRKVALVEQVGGVLGAHKRPFGHASAHLPDLEAFVASLGRAT